MAGMATLALVFALMTLEERRKRHPHARAALGEELAQNPAELLALDFLPRGTNVVAGLHVAALTQNAAGQAFWRRRCPCRSTRNWVGLD